MNSWAYPIIVTKWLIRDKANMANTKKFLINQIKLKDQTIKKRKWFASILIDINTVTKSNIKLAAQLTLS